MAIDFEKRRNEANIAYMDFVKKRYPEASLYPSSKDFKCYIVKSPITEEIELTLDRIIDKDPNSEKAWRYAALKLGCDYFPYFWAKITLYLEASSPYIVLEESDVGIGIVWD